MLVSSLYGTDKWLNTQATCTDDLFTLPLHSNTMHVNCSIVEQTLFSRLQCFRIGFCKYKFYLLRYTDQIQRERVRQNHSNPVNILLLVSYNCFIHCSSALPLHFHYLQISLVFGIVLYKLDYFHFRNDKTNLIVIVVVSVEGWFGGNHLISICVYL